MFDSKSPIIKVAGYIVIGFFLLIIVISFGMPTIMPQAGMDSGTVAVVNGQKLNAQDFLRFRDNLLAQSQIPYSRDMDGFILDRYINNELMYQYAAKEGFASSDERISKTLKRWFTDPDTGKYNPEILKTYLTRSNQSFAGFEKTIKQDMALNDLQSAIYEGTAPSSADVKDEYLCRNSKLQIRYAFLSSNEMKKRFAAKIAVSDADIDAEMKAHPEELKDPATDRERIKSKLEQQKATVAENDMIEQINAIAEAGGSFAAAAGVLGGAAGISNVFAPGEHIKGNELTLLENSDVFRESCMSLPVGVASKAVRAADGIYVFTPILKQISTAVPSEDEFNKLRGEMQEEIAMFSVNNIARKLNEEAVIKRNLRTKE